MKLLNMLILTILFLSAANLQAQSETEPYNAPNEVAEYIQSQMNTKYGRAYILSIYFIMDSLINRIPYDYMDEKYEDPYGTLMGISVFSCQKNTDSEDSSIVGIYKDGNILWDSGPIIFGNILNNLSFCRDINKDSVVDIGLISEFANFTENYNPNNIVDYLWILSWNSNEGIFINDYDINTRKSKLVPGPFRFFDENGDGIFEISSMYSYDNEYISTPVENPPPNYPYVTYGWNGSKYGLWSNVYQLKKGDFYPKIWIEPTITCAIIKKDSLLKFQYTITNGIKSLQKIDYICVTNIPIQNVDESSKYHNGILSSSGIIPNTWAYSPSLRGYSSLINPGQTKSDYWFKGTGLPTITDVYLQGLVDLELTREITVESEIHEIYNNSVKRKTIGLKVLPQQFDTLGFIDTIKTYIYNSYSLGWLKDNILANKYTSYFTTAKSQLQQNNIAGVKSTLNQVLQDVDIDSTYNLTSEAYALIKYNTEYLLNNLPEVTPGFVIKLTNSSGNLLTGGSLKYYEGGWKDAVDNGDGTFSIKTDRQAVSLRMTYEYGSQTVSNVPAQNNTYTFQTVNTKVQLQNSQGVLMPAPMGDEGTVKYYAGAWRDFGATVNGVAAKELLPNNYSFRMTYAYASSDKQQNIVNNPTVVFQTVIANVQLQNSQGQLMDEGTVKYYAGAWRDFGTTVNGIAAKELLPNNYSFRMSYAYASNDKQQNIGDNPTVIYQTVNANVQLKNSLGNLIDQGTVKYYAGAWRDFGTTVNGAAAKELLPNNYSFRMTYEYISNDKQQNIGSNGIIDFSTVLCRVKINDSQNQPVNNADVKYYAGAWRDFGTTVNGEAVKELLPTNISFRASAGGVTQDKQQDIGTNSLVEINLP